MVMRAAVKKGFVNTGKSHVTRRPIGDLWLGWEKRRLAGALQRKPSGGAGASQGQGWGLDGGVSLGSDLSDSSGYTKRVQADDEVPTPRTIGGG